MKFAEEPNPDNLKCDAESQSKRSSASRRDRFRPSPTSRLVLGERDSEILQCLYKFQALSRQQIEALFFTSTARCNRRLRQLYDARLVRRHCPTVTGGSPWGTQVLYTLGGEAVSVLAQEGVDTLEEIGKRCRSDRTPTFLAHSLEVAEVYVNLRYAVQSPFGVGVTLERFLVERECRDEYEIRPVTGGAWQRQIVRPDAYMLLTHEQREYHYFLEVDRGHVSARSFSAKVESYRCYWEHGAFQGGSGGESGAPTPFKVLVITTGQERLKHLCHIVQEQRASSRFLFATRDKMQPETMLLPIWLSGDGDRCITILEGEA